MLFDEQPFQLADGFGQREHFFRRDLLDHFVGFRINNLHHGGAGAIVDAELQRVIDRLNEFVDLFYDVFLALFQW